MSEVKQWKWEESSDYKALKASHELEHAARRMAGTMLYVADVLREVNMDRLADKLERSCGGIDEIIERHQSADSAKVVEQIRHGEEIMHGIVGLALKVAVTNAEGR